MAEAEEAAAEVTFKDFGLDDRLLQAIARQGWERPTLVQERFVPLALEGKDVVTRARTGCGKTAAFAIPVVEKILRRKQCSSKQMTAALVLVPTKELSAQAAAHARHLCHFCSRQVSVVDVAASGDERVNETLLAARPDIVVGTPSAVVALANLEALVEELQFLAVDEADLILSFGHEAHVKRIADLLPQYVQTFLTSATLSDDVSSLKQLLLHNAVVLKLEEGQLPPPSQLAQFHIQCDETEKFVLTYALIKLRLIKGKSIIFVNSTNRCYRLRLFLQQFGITAATLNSEMPANCRCNVVQQFNSGLFDYLIASDDAAVADEAPRSKKAAKRKRSKHSDKDSGVARGIDFQRVANVLNFDFPKSVQSYIHRVGRTARGTNHGTALSFALPDERPLLSQVESVLNEQLGCGAVKPYQFRMEELDGFRYRAMDALRAVTASAVREARVAEIRDEALRSRRLAAFFAERPDDLAAVRNERSLHGVRAQAHLAHVPDYIVPPTLRGVDYSSPRARPAKRRRDAAPVGAAKRRYLNKKADPLHSFQGAADSDDE